MECSGDEANIYFALILFLFVFEALVLVIGEGQGKKTFRAMNRSIN